MKITLRKTIRTRISPCAVSPRENGTPTKSAFHELCLYEDRIARISMQAGVYGCRLSRVLIENRAVVELESYINISDGAFDASNCHHVLKWSQVTLHLKRPQKIKQHGLTAQTVMQIFVERKAGPFLFVLFFSALDILHHLIRNNIARPAFPPTAQAVGPFGGSCIFFLFKPFFRSSSNLTLKGAIELIMPTFPQAFAVLGSHTQPNSNVIRSSG